MKNQNYAFVLIIFMACISLVVLLPRNGNADESVYEVIEFVGSSNSSFQDATEDAFSSEPSYCGFEIMIEEPLEAQDGERIQEVLELKKYINNTGGTGPNKFIVKIKLKKFSKFKNWF